MILARIPKLAQVFRFIGLIAAICAVLCTCPKSVAVQGPDPEVIGRLRHASVYIESNLVLSSSDWQALPEEVKKRLGKRPQGPASGSGFIISTDGYVITNAHVVESTEMKVPAGDPEQKQTLTLHFLPTDLKVVMRSGEEGERSFTPRLVKVDSTCDLALLKIDPDPTLKPLTLRPDKIDAGLNILLAGFPGGKLPDQAPFVNSAEDLKTDKNPRVSINSGMITAIREYEKSIRYQLDARANHGNSGGPVVNAKGEVVGVLFAGIDQMQSINYAIPAQYISRVLPEELRISLGLQPDGIGDNTGGSQTYKSFKDSGTFKLK